MAEDLATQIHEGVVVNSWEVIELNILARLSDQVSEQVLDEIQVAALFDLLHDLSSQLDLALLCVDSLLGRYEATWTCFLRSYLVDFGSEVVVEDVVPLVTSLELSRVISLMLLLAVKKLAQGTEARLFLVTDGSVKCDE